MDWRGTLFKGWQACKPCKPCRTMPPGPDSAELLCVIRAHTRNWDQCWCSRAGVGHGPAKAQSLCCGCRPWPGCRAAALRLYLRQGAGQST
ncbi:hypothetical protein DUNSADRAFT_11495 [Dunaliella salina]|uniref:Encoded protein n=1 Tax=Dunaliella salina TaxID=3046 RepID=A0ABQ7GD75_DUNSA|nr:hypothetical protein DUNSADRAFT_11495 [Dunaliella salina]|eukprot:KAF5832565.1 hypothetical protein DUNSADRAFT_11495 [Dunaliella salina]